MRRVAVVSALLLLAPASAAAHGFDPGVLALHEHAPGHFRVAWTEPVDTMRAMPEVRVVFPEGCRREQDELDCGERGLHGAIAFEGLRGRRTRVVVTIRTLDGRVQQGVIDGSQPRFELDEGPGDSWIAWITVGAEHVWSGFDHVAFVIGLLLVVGFGRARDPALARRALFAISAFTLAHSITLALSVLELVRVPAPPVEATIAASVVLVAREAVTDAPTLTRRVPWLVALLFGLVHGLGFAGALRELGLPEGALGTALAGFNIGVELGQLAVVAAVAIVFRVVGTGLARWPRRLACYAIGGLGACWLLERTVAMVAG